MAKTGWSKSTFEVLTAKGDRWLIDMTSSRKSEAMKCAEDLIAKGSFDGVRVTEQREDWVKEKIVFEKVSVTNEKQLKPNLVSKLDMCTTFSDYYTLSSRLTIGRLIRGYLDQHGLMALELLSNVGHLRALDRMDRYFPSAMQNIAQVQSKITGVSKTERLDKLYVVFSTVLNRARRCEDEYEDYAALLAQHGADRAMSEIKAAHPKNPEIIICGMLAAHLRGGSWDSKLGLVIDIAEQSKGPGTIQLADELIAEILDGAEVIDDLFRGFSTCADAWKVFVLLTSGRLSKPPKYMSPQIERLNALFVRLDLKASRNVLLKRISGGLASTQKLSQDGRDADRTAFITLVRDLAEPTGLCGGADMAEAVVMRAKTLLGADGGDLPIETAIRQALYLMPSQAGRLGLLLDLAASDLGHKHDSLVRQQLLHLLNELLSIFDLFPADVHKEDHIREIDRLRARLSQSTLSDEFQSTVSQSFDELIEGKTEAPTQPESVEPEIKPEAEAVPVPEVEAKVKVNPEPKPKTLVKGKSDEAFLESGVVLFNEEDAGSEAYLIIQGSVEIFRTHAGKKQPLAVVGAGEIIGEMALIDNQPRMASAAALEDTILVCVSQDNLQQRLSKLANDDKVMHLLLKTMVRRLRGLARNTE